MSQRALLTRTQAAWLKNLSEKLVIQVTDLGPDTINFIGIVDYVTWYLEQQPKEMRLSVDTKAALKSLQGYAKKASIQLRTNIAAAIRIICTFLDVSSKTLQKSDIDIPMDYEVYLSLVLHLLITMSSPIESNTDVKADHILYTLTRVPDSTEGITWKEILYEVPFEGEHWHGVHGLQIGHILTNVDDDSGTESSSSSGDFEPRVTNPPTSCDIASSVEPAGSGSRSSLEIHGRHRSPAFLYRKEVEILQLKQYWTSSSDLTSCFSRPCDRNSDLRAILSSGEGTKDDSIRVGDVIDEREAVREILIGLQGRSNILISHFSNMGKIFQTSTASDKLQISDLSCSAQSSILASFVNLTDTLMSLRSFQRLVESVPATFIGSNCRTLEAFAESITFQLQKLQVWCSEKEEEISSLDKHETPLVISLLSLEIELRNHFSDTFFALSRVSSRVICLDLMSELSSFGTVSSLSSIASFLLDELYSYLSHYFSLEDKITYQALLQVFVRTVNPLWSTIGAWLRNEVVVTDIWQENMSRKDLDEEFFIEENFMSTSDTGYWRLGYTLRKPDYDGTIFSESRRGPPIVFQAIASDILSAGKAMKFIRILERGTNFAPYSPSWENGWLSMEHLLSESSDFNISRMPNYTSLLSGFDQSVKTVSPTTLSLLIREYVLPSCQTADKALRDIILEKMDFLLHLQAIHDLYLMQKSDIMSLFSKVLFAHIDTQEHWGDFHTVNSLFRNVARPSQFRWIDYSLVRFTYTGFENNPATGKTVQGLQGLIVRYSVSFPLASIFDEHAFEIYNAVFIFLLQVHRAKSALEQCSLVKQNACQWNSVNLLRSRLLWFVNTLLNFVTTHAIPYETKKFGVAVVKALSLDDIITFHHEHIRALAKICFCHTETTAFREPINIILNLSLEFGQWFTAVVKEISPQAILDGRKYIEYHPSRGLVEQLRKTATVCNDHYCGENALKNVEPLECDSQLFGDSSVDHFVQEVSCAPATFDNITEMLYNLDTLVDFLRKGTHSLASREDSDVGILEVFAFTLRDWYH